MSADSQPGAVAEGAPPSVSSRIGRRLTSSPRWSIEPGLGRAVETDRGVREVLVEPVGAGDRSRLGVDDDAASGLTASASFCGTAATRAPARGAFSHTSTSTWSAAGRRGSARADATDSAVEKTAAWRTDHDPPFGQERRRLGGVGQWPIGSRRRRPRRLVASSSATVRARSASPTAPVTSSRTASPTRTGSSPFTRCTGGSTGGSISWLHQLGPISGRQQIGHDVGHPPTGPDVVGSAAPDTRARSRAHGRRACRAPACSTSTSSSLQRKRLFEADRKHRIAELDEPVRAAQQEPATAARSCRDRARRRP